MPGLRRRRQSFGLLIVASLLCLSVTLYDLLAFLSQGDKDVEIELHTLDLPQQRLHHHDVFPKKTDEQATVLLLVGPHKTGSSSVQYNMWNLIYGPMSTPIFSTKWDWPAPTTEDYQSIGYTYSFSPWKAFAPITARLRRDYKFGNREVSDESVIRLAREKIVHSYAQNKSIIFASEAIDSLCDDEKVNTKEYMDGLLDLIQTPKNTLATTIANNNGDNDNSNIVAVVQYRQPRIKHLISLWHEEGGAALFGDYIIKRHKTFFKTDSLRLAHIFLRKGIPVVIIDINEIQKQNLDLMVFIACHVMRTIPCSDDKTRILGLTNYTSVIKNIKQHKVPIDLSDGVLQKIDTLLHQYDCQYIGSSFVTYQETGLLKVIPETTTMFDNCNQLSNTTDPKNSHTNIQIPPAQHDMNNYTSLVDVTTVIRDIVKAEKKE